MTPGYFAMIRERRDSFWWFAGRRDRIARLMCQHLHSPCAIAADVGCGPGANAPLYPILAERWLCADLSRDSFNDWTVEPERLRLQADATRLPVMEGALQLVLLLDILEHLQNERPVLSEVRRALAPGGLLLISVPAFMVLWSWHDEQAGHYRRYRMAEIKRIANSEGLEILAACYFNSLLAIPIFLARKLFRLTPSMKNKIESDLSPSAANGLLCLWLRFENTLSSIGVHLPFGTSAILLVRKPLTTHGDSL